MDRKQSEKRMCTMAKETSEVAHYVISNYEEHIFVRTTGKFIYLIHLTLRMQGNLKNRCRSSENTEKVYTKECYIMNNILVGDNYNLQKFNVNMFIGIQFRKPTRNIK